MPKGTDSRNDPRRKVGRPIIEPIGPSDDDVDKSYRELMARRENRAKMAAELEGNEAAVKARREATFGPDVPRPGTGPRRELRQDASGTFHIVNPESPDKSIPLVNELDPYTFQPKGGN